MAHPRKQLLFAALSLADLALTCWLLGGSGGRVYEANPVAAWWLDRFGWAGLACFKAGAVAMVLGLAVLIARSRPEAAGLVPGLGCAVTASVVLYSASLLRTALCPQARAAAIARAGEDELAAINSDARAARQKYERFSAELSRKAEEVAAGRISLEEAAGWAADTEAGRDPVWRRALVIKYEDRPLREALAALVMSSAVSSAGARGPQAAERLEREFKSTYGTAPPVIHRSTLAAANGRAANKQFAVGTRGQTRVRPGGAWAFRSRLAKGEGEEKSESAAVSGRRGTPGW